MVCCSWLEFYRNTPGHDFHFAGSFLCNLVLDGIAYSFGILLKPMQDDLHTSVGSVSLIGGVLAGVILASGPVAAAIVNRYYWFILLEKGVQSV
jgi:hypothetical protein